MADLKKVNYDKFFEKFNDKITKYVAYNMKLSGEQTLSDMKARAINEISNFYKDYTYSPNIYRLHVPIAYMPHDIPNGNWEKMFNAKGDEMKNTVRLTVYWHRTNDLYNAINTEFKDRGFSKNGKTYYECTSILTITSKTMDQSKHRLNVDSILKNSFEFGKHGFSRNDVDKWEDGNTHWYLPRNLAPHVQKKNKRGKYSMDKFYENYKKKILKKGVLYNRTLENSFKSIIDNILNKLK